MDKYGKLKCSSCTFKKLINKLQGILSNTIFPSVEPGFFDIWFLMTWHAPVVNTFDENTNLGKSSQMIPYLFVTH